MHWYEGYKSRKISFVRSSKTMRTVGLVANRSSIWLTLAMSRNSTITNRVDNNIIFIILINIGLFANHYKATVICVSTVGTINVVSCKAFSSVAPKYSHRRRLLQRAIRCAVDYRPIRYVSLIQTTYVESWFKCFV